MANMFKKTVCMLLVLAMAGVSLASCSNGGGKTPSSTTASSGDGTATTTAGETSYTANYPAGTNYEGYEFNIHCYPNDGGTWGDVDFSATEETGDVLNDAVYTRMRNVNEKLNVVITPIYETSSGAALQKAVQSETNAYDVGFVDTFSGSTLSQGGYLMNLHDNPTLDLTAAWWDQNAVSELSIANKLFMVTGDIGTMYKKSIGVILFNKQQVTNYNLDNPYTLVKDMNWTIDQFINMSKQVSEDIDSSGTWDNKDKYGLLYYCDMIALGLIGAGVNFATKDADDLPVISFYSDKTLQIFEKYTELLYDETLSYSWSKTGIGNDGVIAMFQDNRGLFNFNEFHSIENMRQMDTDFGILPMPLYEQGQDSYHHVINPHVAAMLVIPKSSLDQERIGYVLDALGAESKNILTPAYYDKYLKGKGARDNDSEATLDIVFSTLKYDPGYLYNWGNLGQFTLTMVDRYNSNLTSSYEKIAKTIDKALTKALEKYEANT